MKRAPCLPRTSLAVMTRAWLHEKTQGMVRSSWIRSDAVLEDGRLPMLSLAISAIGVRARNTSAKPSVS